MRKGPYGQTKRHVWQESDIPGLRETIPLRDSEIKELFFRGFRNDVAFTLSRNYGYYSHPIGRSFSLWMFALPIILGMLAVSMFMTEHISYLSYICVVISIPLIIWLFIEYTRIQSVYRPAHPFVYDYVLLSSLNLVA